MVLQSRAFVPNSFVSFVLHYRQSKHNTNYDEQQPMVEHNFEPNFVVLE